MQIYKTKPIHINGPRKQLNQLSEHEGFRVSNLAQDDIRCLKGIQKLHESPRGPIDKRQTGQ